ncbi:MAG: hypothetical protein AB1765_06670 [Candidatus Hydrogenedentota bacterium]
MNLIDFKNLNVKKIIFYGVLIVALIFLSRFLIPFPLIEYLAKNNAKYINQDFFTFGFIEEVVDGKMRLSFAGYELWFTAQKQHISPDAVGNWAGIIATVNEKKENIIKLIDVAYSRPMKVNISILGFIFGCVLMWYLLKNSSFMVR